MEQDILKETTVQVEENNLKRKKIDDTNDYWKQFDKNKENDFFSTLKKKKSKLEQEKENAIQARIKEYEEMGKNKAVQNARKQVVLAFDL